MTPGGAEGGLAKSLAEAEEHPHARNAEDSEKSSPKLVDQFPTEEEMATMHKQVLTSPKAKQMEQMWDDASSSSDDDDDSDGGGELAIDTDPLL